MHAFHDRAALVLELFDSYYERVYAFLRKSATSDVAEELAQETFLRLMQHPELERLTISVSYLLKIAHNLLRRRYARAIRLRELLAERGTREQVCDDVASVPAIDRDVLETALGLIGKDERDAIRLIVCEGCSYQHAAESLGVSVATVNNWKHRGLAKLRRILVADGTEAAAGIAVGHATRSVPIGPRTGGSARSDAGPHAAAEIRREVEWRMRAEDAA